MDTQNISRIVRGLVNPSAYAINQIWDVLEILLAIFYTSMSNKAENNANSIIND